MRLSAYKIAVIFLMAGIIAVFCFSCVRRSVTEKNQVAKLMSKGFTCTASVKWNTDSYEIKINRPSSGECTMAFLKPDQLAPLSFSLASDGLTVKYGGIQASLDPASLPQSSLFDAVVNVFDTAASSNALKTFVKNQDTYISGNTSAGGFTLRLGAGGIPKTLSIPSQKLNVTFEQFQFTN